MPFGLSYSFFLFSSFFCKFLRITQISSLAPLEERYPGAPVISNSGQKPMIPSPDEGPLRAGRKIIVEFSPHATMCIFPQVYMSRSGAKGISNRAGIVGLLGLISISILAFGSVVLICLCLIRFPLCHTTMSWFRFVYGLCSAFILYSVRDYVCDLYYVSNVIRLGGSFLFFMSADIPYIPGFEIHYSRRYSHMALLGSATICSRQFIRTFQRIGSNKKQKDQKK